MNGDYSILGTWLQEMKGRKSKDMRELENVPSIALFTVHN
jgi:hypothetical protein